MANPTPRRRGRPARSATQVADMRAHIAAAALKLFQSEGYAAVSMRRLAGEAGCTPMTLYSYFENKIDILRALWADVLAELFDGLDRIAAAEPDPVARLNAVAQGYVAYWLTHRDHYFMIFMSGGLTRADVTGFVQGDAALARFDLFRICLAQALGDGPPPQDLRVKSEALLCALNGTAHNLITIGGYDWATPEALVQEAVAGLLRHP
ncbi:TetR family transcriptional regulator [Rhodovulum bhavnagarense]|uniref:TetR family transcriptional regulator n=1 Tax=Rhodovulum bhavnagarense TaxID=992286 RepID=A0A4R2RFC3_9RHOB|nr:TetR/AcrR family transcriptional regulator [Rhodovulum bhavnagarense]TCP61583.1 TetR family transcriptional regulator [Rhodovulum bhavnagarense]